MLDRDFKYNSEGYYDPTAYIALSRVQEEENMQNRTGELWEISSNNSNTEFKALILADNGDIVTILKLQDTKQDKHDIQVVCGAMMYTCSSMIQYAFSQNLERYIRTVTESVFDEIKAKVAKTLGIDTKVKVIEKVVEKEPELELAPVELPEVKLEQLVPDDSMIVTKEEYTELIKDSSQKEVYKELYDNLQEKLLSKAMA